MSEFLSNVTLLKKDKSVVKGKDVLGAKVVGLYFSAHWCGPCRNFTPLLKKMYEELNGQMEIVFVSFDNSQRELDAYLEEAHGDWYHLDREDKTVEELASKYKVNGIPHLVIIKPNGDIITDDATSDVYNKTAEEALTAWKAVS